MRVIHVINSLATGGAEKLILDTLPLYKKKGLEVDLLLLWDNDCEFTKKIKESNSCRVHILKQSTNFKAIYNPFSIIKIAKIIKDYDLVHVHLFPAQYFVAFANMLNQNTSKLLFTEHNTSNTRTNNKIFKPIENFIYKKYKTLICITSEIEVFYKNYLKSNNTQIVCIENGVAIDEIIDSKAINKYTLVDGLNPKDIVLLQVAAFRNQKDQLTLIKATQILPDNYKLILVGEGVNKSKCQEFVTQQNLSYKVFFLGQRMDVHQLLKSVDLVVLSSHYEGLSLASIEGMASGVPFIASRVPGLENIVENYGVLFTQGDEKELAAIIINLMEDAKLYQKTAALCIERAKQFDIKIMVDKHVELYHQVYEA